MRAHAQSSDPQAIAIAAQTLAVMMPSGTAPTDALVQGNATMPDNTSFAITIECIGTNRIRMDATPPSGQFTRIVNAGIGALVLPSGVKSLNPDNTLFERAVAVPVLSLIAEYQGSGTYVNMVNSLTTSTTAVIDVGLNPHPASDDLPEQTVRYFIDTTTYLVSSVQYLLESEDDPTVHTLVETDFTNYQSISGFAVPFAQASFADGAPQAFLQANSVAFNTGISDSDFVVPGVN